MKKVLTKVKKRGFTLIELLAVIVILGVIILIATTRIANNTKKAKEEAFIEKTYLFLKAAEFAEVEVEDGNFEKIYKFPGDTSLTLTKYPDAGFIMRSQERTYKLQIWDDKLKICAVKDFDTNNITISKTIKEKDKCIKIPGDESADESSLAADEYQIIYHANFEGDTSDVTQILKKDLSQKLISNPFTKENHEFTYWSTKSDGSGDIYANEELVTNPTTKKTMHLYANWSNSLTCANNKNITITGNYICKNNSVIKTNSSTVCKKALSLHQEKCLQTSNYCNAAGYSVDGTKNTDIVTYGNCGSVGTLAQGDAFTCDVNKDNIFDELNERFYYIGKHYNTQNLSFDDNIAVLAYYSSLSNGTACNYNMYSYGSNKENPTNLRANLPTTTMWPNVTLSEQTRRIVAQNNKIMNTSFSYEGYAARPMLIQELSQACSNIYGGDGTLDKCNFILENTKYTNPSVRITGSQFENPDNFYSGMIWVYRTSSRKIDRSSSGEGASFALRPVIDVPVENIAY